MDLIKKAKELQLFDKNWYRTSYNLREQDEEKLFEHYLKKSTYANVDPSPHFSTELYLKQNIDIYHQGMSPLTHYLLYGEKEGRVVQPSQYKWIPKKSFDVTRHELSSLAYKMKLAITLHIFYEDYIYKFYEILKSFPLNFDVFISLSSKSFFQKSEELFNKIKNVGSVKLVISPNRGRNFGGLLVDFSTEVENYDLFCHMHSKKSLYSGREQVQWSSYLNEYLLNDQSVLIGMINSFCDKPKLGIYYPTNFWMLPSWVNHWLRNKTSARNYLGKVGIYDLDLCGDFFSYPVGGMFWARPEALKQILQKEYNYNDFPDEPLPNDGTELHAIERLLGKVAEYNGYEQFYYHPPSASFTSDDSYIYHSYNKALLSVRGGLNKLDVVSFDIFDTLVRRQFHIPDYAKYLLGKRLVEKGLFDTPNSFVEFRNNVENEIRKEKKFQGDVHINEIYSKISFELKCSKNQAIEWMNLEFYYDLEMILPKNEIVDLLNNAYNAGSDIYIVSDTYYTQDQIRKILLKVGVVSPYTLFVSSHMEKRKDNGTMWSFIKDSLNEYGIKSFLHIGDNVISDAQIAGDYGLRNFHILAPYDKWIANGFHDILKGMKDIDESLVLKWGALISNNGSYPMLVPE